MLERKPCWQCGRQVSKRAKKCPGCGVRGPAGKKPDLSPTGTLVFLVLFLVVGGGLYLWIRDTPEERAVKAARMSQERATERAKAAADREAGFHCLSSWDGSHHEVVDHVKQRLRDPRSFEHVDTKITPVDSAGEHQLLMRYRATNGFGGMTFGMAGATFKNDGCAARITAVE